jgi:thiol-disulfide isomerase/thioredoxin
MFADQKQTGLKVLVFSKTNCKPCDEFKPIVEAVCDESETPCNIIYKENDKDNMFGRYAIDEVPSLVILKDTSIWIHKGRMLKSEVRNVIEEMREK